MLVTMSDKELSRINIIQSVVEKRMRRRDAAHQLALTERQTQRLMNRFRESGAAGLANLRRGRSCEFFRYFTIITATLDQRWPQKNCANAITSRCLLKH